MAHWQLLFTRGLCRRFGRSRRLRCRSLNGLTDTVRMGCIHLHSECLGLILFCGFMVGCQTEKQPNNGTNNHRNVLFIVADDLNCDLSTYGHPVVQTPHPDAFADRAVVFTNAHAHTPLWATGVNDDGIVPRSNQDFSKQHLHP